MKSIHEQIWDKALPYQDKRDDAGHAEVVVEYANKICNTEKVNPDVVMPAAILHDIGWSKLTKSERMLIFDDNIPKEKRLKMRYKHQDKGVEEAETILKKIKYEDSLIPEILEIISQHDTRKGFISDNEGAMRDADKLWRYDRRGFISDRRRISLTVSQHLQKLHNNLQDPDFFYFDTSIKLAEQILIDLEKEYKT